MFDSCYWSEEILTIGVGVVHRYYYIPLVGNRNLTVFLIYEPRVKSERREKKREKNTHGAQSYKGKEI